VRWWHAGLAVALAAIALPLLADRYTLTVAAGVAIYAIIAASMTLVSGSAADHDRAGRADRRWRLHLAILTVVTGWSFWPALIVAGLLSAWCRRCSPHRCGAARHYVAIATLGIGSVAVAVIRNWSR